MRLAIVSPYPPAITGIGQYGFHISRLLARSGAFTHIQILTGKTAGAIAADSQIHIEPLWESNQWSNGARISARLKHLRPDLVWFNFGASIFGRSPLANLSGFASILHTQRLGLPSVVTLHELPELADLRSLQAPGGRLAKYGARALTGLAMHADVVCLTIRRYMDWLAPHHANEKYFHIPLGAYDTPEMLPAAEDPELLFFTTLAPFKGLEVLLEAYRSLQESYPNLRLTIAGAEHVRFPQYASHLKNIYAGMKGVRWLGQVAEEEVRSLFQRAQIVTLPYNASTGASSVLAQAAAFGRPVVASELPEIESLVRENGFDVTFFKRGEAAALAAALRLHLASPERGRAQAAHNLAAIQRHRPEDTCRGYLHAFNRALEARRSSKRIALPPLHAESAQCLDA